MQHLEQVFEDMVEHYAKLASHPGFYDYARHRVAQMMKEEPRLWGTLGERVKKRLEEMKHESGAGLPAGRPVSEPQER